MYSDSQLQFSKLTHAHLPTFKVLQAGEIERLDGIEALLEVSGSLFDDSSGRQRDGPSALEVGFALEEEHEQPHRQITCGRCGV